VNLKGRFGVSDRYGYRQLKAFNPDGLGLGTRFLGGGAVPASEPLRACLECGLVWCTVSPKELILLIAKRGKQATKEQFGL
jgi:hypothetical protein